MVRRIQRQMKFRTWGGARKGAGRKPKGLVAGVSHATRERISGREPLHVTLKVRKDIPSLRTKQTLKLLKSIFSVACLRFGFRLAQFSVQRTHLHLVAEATDWRSLAVAVKALCRRIAHAMNTSLGRKGAVFADRYHARVLKTPLEVRNALVYVLQNGAKHGEVRRGALDPFSSAAYFQGWTVPPPPQLSIDPPVATPRTWLLRVGWLARHGPIRPTELPRSA